MIVLHLFEDSSQYLGVGTVVTEQGMKSYHHCRPVLQSVVRKCLVLSELCLGQPSAISHAVCSMLRVME